MVKPAFRVIDTGLREGRSQIAFDRALIEAHQAGEVPDTIRFLRFPPTALIGRHQALSHEVRLDHCYENDIGVVRRITGGGAIYFDEGQLGWELAFDRKTLGISSLADLTRTICEAAALGISNLGVDAKYRPRNDIEVDGRKICGTGGFFDGDTLFYQGTLLIDMDPSHMVATLKVPAAKLKKRALDSAEQRVTTLKALLGDDVPTLPAIQNSLLAGFAVGLGIEPAWGEITAGEETRARAAFNDEIGTDEFVHEIDDPGAGENILSASHTGPGGTVACYLRLEETGMPRLREVLFTGDFFVTPPRVVFDLEASLRGVPIAEAGNAVEKFFTEATVDLLTIVPTDFRTVLEQALSVGAET